LIFVALGTHEQPFERALDIVGPLADEHELVIQHGHTPPRAGLRAEWIDFRAYDEIVELMRGSDAVVCHAGVGTIMTALSIGKHPVVLPRLAAHGEHVDDHQLQITTTFADRGVVVACLTPSEIADALERAGALPPPSATRVGDLFEAVREATAGDGEPRRAGATIPDPGTRGT
jgi:UDP-N-acetylglucosamine transferase subunit ALG13